MSMRVEPGRHVDAADRDRHAREPEVALDGALDAQRLFDEVRDPVTLAAQQPLQIRVLRQHLERGAEQPDGRFLARREDVRRDAHDVDHFGQRAVREGGRGKAAEHVAARLAAAVLDVGGELVVEELQRVVRHRLVATSSRCCASVGRRIIRSRKRS